MKGALTAEPLHTLLSTMLEPALGAEVVWEPTPACPQGHAHWSFDYATREVEWYEAPGAVCLTRMEEALDGWPHIAEMNLRGSMDRYRELTALRETFRADEHLEWRIGRVPVAWETPRDFWERWSADRSDLVQPQIFRNAGGYHVILGWQDGSALGAWFHGHGPTITAAAARAWAGLLETQQEARSGASAPKPHTARRVPPPPVE